jgi:hypothetical protein
MAKYRYSEEGIESLARKVARRSLVFILIAFLGGVAAVWVNVAFAADWRPGAFAVGVVMILGIVVGFRVWRNSGRNATKILRSAEFELDQDTLTARNSLATTKLGRDEVTEIRYMKDGILVRGANLRQWVQVKPELQGFPELATSLEDWVPASVRRKRSSSSLTLWFGLLVVGNLGLAVIAFSATTPIVAIPCCILEAVVLIGCAALVWRSKTVAPRLKWMTLAGMIPIFSLIFRAYFLSQSH